MSSPDRDTTVQPIHDLPSRTSEGDGNGWNGDPMDWESWPTGRPGPFVSEATMRAAMDQFQARGPTDAKEKVFHIAEFSSTGRGESSTVAVGLNN